METERLKSYLTNALPDAAGFLGNLVRIPSTRGGEGPVAIYLMEQMSALVDRAELIPIPDDIMKDPDYAFRQTGVTYAGRPNVLMRKEGTEPGKRVIINVHMDVVPPSAGQETPFEPREKDGFLYGRGACDAKAQAAVVYLALRASNDLAIEWPGEIEIHFVVEEECGGNGTLAMIRRGCRADAALVMEPTDLRILPSVRGAVWFELVVSGRPGHSGTPGSSVSALKKAYVAMAVLEKYHDELLAASRGNPLFDAFADPMPVTFGTIEAGDWPATAPSKAVLRGVFGFLPPKGRHEVQGEMRAALALCEDEWLRENFELRFPMLNSDGNELDVTHAFVRAMEAAHRKSGRKPELSALTGSCDAWWYANQGKIPTIVFGAGSLGTAHGNNEHVRLTDLASAAEIMIHFLTIFSRT